MNALGGDIIELIKALLAGILVGLLFAAIKLPIPAPSAFIGIVGILGIFLGYLAWNKFF